MRVKVEFTCESYKSDETEAWFDINNTLGCTELDHIEDLEVTIIEE